MLRESEEEEWGWWEMDCLIRAMIGKRRLENINTRILAMINLDSIFKSRDITLPTKVQLVKAMVFPVVMYGCESWTVKKAEH